MVTIDAIAEIHAIDAISDIFEEGYYSKDIVNKILSHFEYDDELNFVDNDFWEQINNFLKNKGQAHHQKRRDEGVDSSVVPLINDADYQKTEDLFLECLGISKEILWGEVELLREGRYSVIYFEGTGDHYVSVVARKLNVKSIHLDVDNPHYATLIGQQYHSDSDSFRELQQRREDLWVDRVRTPGLIIAGSKHIVNSYGFIDKLAAKGIAVDVKLDYGSLGNRLDNIRGELFEINQRGLRNYTVRIHAKMAREIELLMKEI